MLLRNKHLVIGALHLQVSFLPHKSSLPLCWEIKTHISLSFTTSITFHTASNRTLMVSAPVQSSAEAVGVWSCRISLWAPRQGWGQQVLLGTAQGSSKGWGCRAGSICRLAVTSALSLKHRNMFLASCGHINSGKLISLLLKGKPFWILKEQWTLWQGALRYF